MLGANPLPMTSADALVGSRVLVIEDDPRVRRSLERALRSEGLEVTVAADGAEGLEVASSLEVDVVVLDVVMPVIGGLDVVRRLRARGFRIPVLMLTARYAVSDRVAGLDAGADDYLVKPFALDELLARLRALLRRTSLSDDPNRLQLADLVLDPAARRVSRGDRDIQLTKTEFDLLELLMLNAGIVLSRDLIFDRIWGITFETSSNSLDVYIGYLRRKTEVDDQSRLIHTVWGVGYVMRAS
jgi:two-component system response regulator MprA